ncbi:hypothetical protein [Streptomyces sp. I05A-00742]|uniref:hypothetical protein n=1 Tax=Streptomyces sp. I05A-00742 TaxID=2732853 RepID=UPI001489B980|nr:hypothetical protein [Streptomyces sp. I05A-00742]
MQLSRPTDPASTHPATPPTVYGRRPRRLAAGLGAALLALSGSALAAPATAAQQRAAAVPAGDYCGPADSFYGGGQYTYAEVQVCLRFGSGGNQVIVNNRNVQYLWGGSWYNASSNYPAKWHAVGSVSVGGQWGSYATPDPVTQGSANGWAGGGSPAALGACGTYNVSMMFRQNGPYWTDSSNDIDSGERSYQVSVPC